jgi:putative membrane protein
MPPAPHERPSDADIAAIFLAANNTDVSYARLAPSRAQSAAVKQFAERMLADHTALNKSMDDLLATLQLTPEDNPTSLDFRDESSDESDILRGLEGHAFDTTYMANEVTYHAKFLASLDNVLIPSARNLQLKLLLVSVRPAVAGHLTHAEQTRAAVLAKP